MLLNKPWVTFLCQDMNKLQEETNEVNKRASLLEKENQRARKQIADLSQQVLLTDWISISLLLFSVSHHLPLISAQKTLTNKLTNMW